MVYPGGVVVQESCMSMPDIKGTPVFINKESKFFYKVR